ncbi:MAG TPA: hypothetical protein IAA29_10320 [Candidatus Paenibacillus intestinavium]|nr:hypothetical protein [Candidatus Paenibacillus intestinavium]
MYHTINLVQAFSFHEYYAAIEAFVSLGKVNSSKVYRDPRNANVYIVELLKQHGMVIKLYKNDIAKHAKIEIRLNPKRLIDGNEYVLVAKESDYENIVLKFRRIMEPIQKQFIANLISKEVIESEEKQDMVKGRLTNASNLAEIDDYNIMRIDYCINVITERSSQYMELIRRGDVPTKFEMKYDHNPQTGKRKRYEDSMYLITRSKDIKLNFYNKEKQMEGMYSEYDKIEDAQNMLRFEVQCSGTKVNNMKAYYQLESKQLSMFSINQMALETVVGYYVDVVGKEDYVTLSFAKSCIDSNMNFGSKDKIRMIDVLGLINQKRSVYLAREAFIKESSNEITAKKIFNQALKSIKALRINPVTIPVNWGIDKLPNLYDEVIKAGASPDQVIVTFGLR